MRNRLLPFAVCRLPAYVVLFLLFPLECCTAYWEQTTPGVRFSGSELRETLSQYAKIQQIGFMLDRRVDPGLQLEFEMKNVSGLEMFARLADQMGLGFCRVGEIAYLGPKDAAVKLERILAVKRQSLASAPAAVRRTLTQKIRLQTEKLDTPQEILRRVAQRMRTKIGNPDRIPHDLWPELDFPEADAYELLSILLIGFDLTFEIGDHGITFVPLPGNLPVVPEARGNRPEMAPPVTTTRSQNAPPALKDLRFEMVEIKNKTVNEVLRYYADNLGLQVVIDEKSLRAKGISLEQRISFQRDQADIHELLRATLEPIGCTYQLSGKRLRVFSK